MMRRRREGGGGVFVVVGVGRTESFLFVAFFRPPPSFLHNHAHTPLLFQNRNVRQAMPVFQAWMEATRE